MCEVGLAIGLVDEPDVQLPLRPLRRGVVEAQVEPVGVAVGVKVESSGLLAEGQLANIGVGAEVSSGIDDRCRSNGQVIADDSDVDAGHDHEAEAGAADAVRAADRV